MFEIKIVTPPEETHINPATGQIKINKFAENFTMSFSSWMPEDYFNHWESAITKLLKKKNSTEVLISEITSSQKRDYIRLWALYREGDTVYIQNKLFFLKWLKGKFDVNKLPEAIGPRETETPDGEIISEWSAGIKDFEDYLKKLPKLREPYAEYIRKRVESVYIFKQ